MKETKVDATGKSFGRLASETAKLIMGKDELDFDSSKVAKVKVLISNIEAIKIDANKLTKKLYYTHSGYIGNLKKATMKEKVAQSREKYLLSVIKNMLPDNRLRVQRLRNITFEKNE